MTETPSNRFILLEPNIQKETQGGASKQHMTSENLLKGIKIYDERKNQSHLIPYEPNSKISLYQEKARVVGDFYANQYQLLIPKFSAEDVFDLSEGQQFELYTDDFSLGCSELVSQKKEELYVVFRQVHQKWAIARKWLIKLEWERKLPARCIHPNKGIRDRAKPLGELLQAYWILCEKCHSRQDSVGVKIPYDNAAQWFADVFYNLLLLNMGRSLLPKGAYKIHNNNIKQSRLEIEKDDLRLLKTDINPFIATVNTNAVSVLITTSICLLEVSDVFRDDVWKRYLKAMSAYIKQMNQPESKINIVKKGKHYLQEGRGQGKKIVGCVDDYKKIFFTTLAD